LPVPLFVVPGAQGEQAAVLFPALNSPWAHAVQLDPP
jgi:hypothetical protein